MDGWSAATVLAGYLLGSIDFGVIIPRLRGVDIYAVGSGNPGASNVLRVMGRATAASVMVGDLLKGLAATALGTTVGTDALGFAAGGAAVAGHCFPLWHRFRGGKGVATSAGLTLWMEPLLGVVLLAAWTLVVGLSRRASVASLVLLVVYVPSLALLGYRDWALVWAGSVCLLVLVRHWANIRRLLSGSEHTVKGTSR